eukprot:5925405-Amphidinium_carterae.3
MAGTLGHNTTVGILKAQKRRLCVRSKATLVYNNSTLEQFQQHLELKYTSQLTRTTPLEFLAKTLELQDDGTLHLSFAQQYYDKIMRAYNMDKCSPTTPGMLTLLSRSRNVESTTTT